MKSFFVILFLLCMIFICPALTHAYTGYVPKQGDSITASDYSNRDNWLSQPGQRSKPVDVFYIYPTAWRAAAGQSPVASIDYLPMRLGAQVAYAMQASAFDTVGEIFCPYYRQLDAAFTLSKSFAQQEEYMRGVPKTDLFAAFAYYIKHLNKGRPFIIAAHSQGAALARELLIEYFKTNPQLSKQLVAAYVIGFSVTRQDLAENPHLKFAQGPDDTGVIISYNTEGPNVRGKNNTLLPGAIAINPITWTRGEELAVPSQNLGSYLEVDGEWQKVMQVADAKVNVDRGVVVCYSVDPNEYSYPESARELFPLGVFHRYDYSFYYYNIRENAQNRVNKFLGK